MLEDEYKIIKRAQRGDQEHFGRLYDHYTPQIYRFVFFKVGHQQEAEDLTHEIFLNAWKNIDNFTYRGHPFSSWLYQIARNRIIDYYRSVLDSRDGIITAGGSENQSYYSHRFAVGIFGCINNIQQWS